MAPGPTNVTDVTDVTAAAPACGREFRPFHGHKRCPHAENAVTCRARCHRCHILRPVRLSARSKPSTRWGAGVADMYHSYEGYFEKRSTTDIPMTWRRPTH
jgi:nitrate/TMAO reductase-like tetraheme cytochrome c subunit